MRIHPAHLPHFLTPSRRHFSLLAFIGILSANFSFLSPLAHATLFADISGVVHDVQHHSLASAQVELTASHSAFHVSAQTGPDGSFRFPAVPFGEYTLIVRHPDFETVSEAITVASGTSPVLHIALPIATVAETANVTGAQSAADSGSVTPTVLLSQGTIQNTPGAARGDSLAMITDYVPGAYITHDMLHMRGGHQVSWLLDGVQIPNTNIASNLGPQVDPRDIQYLQIDRGSYSADLGDRTYGIFDVNPKSGFERNREGELIATAGSALETDNHLSFGDHPPRAAYYLSVDGNRSDYGLSPPIEQAVHNAEDGYGSFGSFILNKDAKDQFRLLTQLRTDFFQIPHDPDSNDYENQLYDSSGLRDSQHETDGVAAFTWGHSFNTSTVLNISPFFHYNSANYTPNLNDTPTATTSDRASSYAGVQAGLTGDIARNHLQAGLYAWGQHDSDLFAVSFNDVTAENFRESDSATGGLVEEYVSDSYKPTSFLTLTAGLRQSYFSGSGFTETATYPRFGAGVEVPRLHWVFRAFYGHFYQPPPLVTVSGSLLAYANSGGTGSLRWVGNAMKNISSAYKFPTKAGFLMPTPSKPRPRTSSTTPTSVNPAFTFP